MHILSALWIHGEILTVGTFFPVPYSLSSSLSAACVLYAENQILTSKSCWEFRGFRQFSCLLSLRRSNKDLGRICHMNGNSPVTKIAVSLDALPVFLLFHSFDRYFEDLDCF